VNHPTRRQFGQAALGTTALAAVAGALPGLFRATPAAAAPGDWQHALSLMGEVKYPAGFPHFSYVNPAAPKGGVVRFGVQGTFDNFNPVIAEVKGNIAGGVGQIFEPLMTSSLDEVATEYGQLAEAVRYPEDYSAVTYRLREGARWHDGQPVTPGDVIWSFETWKRLAPSRNKYYLNVVKAEETAPREITFTFDIKNNRELPQIVGQLLVLPRHWWEGTGPNGTKRDIEQTTLEPPLGSGPYRIARFDTGRTLVLERVRDYWGTNLPVQVGINNFDEIRFEYFRDATVLVEAFKGDQFDFRSENSARQWMTSYDFPAMREGRIVREEFELRASGVMQAFVFNLRREKFQDVRVRRAFNFAFDFEEANKNLFFGLYQRPNSFFSGTELASSGLPTGKELEILETVRDKVPAEVFTTPFTNPVNGTQEAVRANLREALRLLTEAGYELRGRQLVNRRTGEQLTAEFLVDSPAFERVVVPYKAALERLGIGVTLRVVDPVQSQNRERTFDFDIVTDVKAQSLSPGNEQRDYWGSLAADRQGSGNLAGLKDPAVDILIDRVIFARDREELIAATKALDRVLLSHHFVVPQWRSGKQLTLRWDRFSRPETLPRYGASAFPTIWWWDEAKARRTGGRT
jgi:microcin C transport system substrate-binding protein